MNSYENTAQLILDALHIEHAREFIDGITAVLVAQHDAINNEWEAYIRLSTNEILTIDNICCKQCNAPIQICRTYDTIFVGEEEE